MDEHRQRRYLPSIDGLRAIAVVVVVLHHAEIPGFERGFVGVDVFFAISGFLITQRLVTSVDEGTTQPLSQFWAGRARRILPAMATVVVVTCLACLIWLSPEENARIAIYGVASNLFSVNLLAAWRGGNYFSGPLRDLPFLHLWSLAVEEQFYLLWPLLLGVVTRGVQRVTRTTYRRAVAWVIGLCSFVSLICSVVLTETLRLWAFYGPWARLYELALGAAAALFFVGRPLGPRREAGARIVGAAMIAASLVVTPIDAGFPSAWPLLSAGGATLLLVVAGTADGSAPADRLLGSRPMRVIGQASYGWYLWHWPAWVLVSTLVGRGAARVATVAAILPALAAQRLVENPIRFHPRLVGSTRRSLAVGAAVTLLAASASAALWGSAKYRLRDPEMRELVDASSSWEADDCDMTSDGFAAEVCVGGATDAERTVLLVGDSHAAQWMNALSAAGRERGFRVALSWAGLCPWAPLSGPTSDRSPDCASHRSAVTDLLSSSDVDAVLFADTPLSRLTVSTVDEWERAATRTIERARHDGRAVGFLVDNPSFGNLSWLVEAGEAGDIDEVTLSRPLRVDAVQCVARGGSDADCAPARRDAFAALRAFEEAERRLVAGGGVARLDLSDSYCHNDPCELRDGETWIVAANDHLTGAFTMSKRDEVADFVETLLGAGSPS